VYVTRARWWVFDRPILRDPLFLLGVLLGVGLIGLTLSRADGLRPGALVISLLAAIPSALVAVGTLLGSARAYRRGRAGS
jgi:hypothetical protein